MIRTGWRLVPAPQSSTAFDGEGARRYGGRWNSVGVPMVYASEHQSLAVLEVRVHIAMSTLYKSFAFDFDEALMQTFPGQELPQDWQHEPPPISLQRLGDEWVRAGAAVILAVPSAIVPNELNLLINPRHPDISKVHIHPAADFILDRRLFH